MIASPVNPLTHQVDKNQETVLTAWTEDVYKTITTKTSGESDWDKSTRINLASQQPSTFNPGETHITELQSYAPIGNSFHYPMFLMQARPPLLKDFEDSEDRLTMKQLYQKEMEQFYLKILKEADALGISVIKLPDFASYCELNPDQYGISPQTVAQMSGNAFIQATHKFAQTSPRNTNLLVIFNKIQL